VVVVVVVLIVLTVAVEQAVLELSSFVISAHSAVLVAQSHHLVYIPFTHLHQAAHSQHKDKKWKNYKSPHNFSIHSLAI
jgi:hypothetical protein